MSPCPCVGAGLSGDPKLSPAAQDPQGVPSSTGALGPDPSVSLPADVVEGAEEGDPELLALQGEEAQPEAPKQKKRWMDFDQFCVCFR